MYVLRHLTPPSSISCARYLVFEHSILLVYGSEEDWAEHREPLDGIAISRESTVELCLENGEVRTTSDRGCRVNAKSCYHSAKKELHSIGSSLHLKHAATREALHPP